jgi:hypothetical protein
LLISSLPHSMRIRIFASTTFLICLHHV